VKAVRWVEWILWWEGFLEKVDFESEVENSGSNGRRHGWDEKNVKESDLDEVDGMKQEVDSKGETR